MRKVSLCETLLSRASLPLALLLSTQAILLVGCNRQTSQSEVVKSKNLASIVTSGLRNPEMSRAISRRLTALRTSDLVPTGELEAAGFVRAPDSATCTTFRYQGETSSKMARDDTLRITYRECAETNGGMKTALEVNFGDK